MYLYMAIMSSRASLSWYNQKYIRPKVRVVIIPVVRIIIDGSLSIEFIFSLYLPSGLRILIKVSYKWKFWDMTILII